MDLPFIALRSISASTPRTPLLTSCWWDLLLDALSASDETSLSVGIANASPNAPTNAEGKKFDFATISQEDVHTS